MGLRVTCYFLEPSSNAPNNRLPVLHYHNVLLTPLTEENATRILISHKWEKRGTWGHIAIRHFHPNSHECYGIFQGRSTLLLGSLDVEKNEGLKVNVQAGDVIVLPAGTAHSSVESSQDYRYIGVYPQGSPRWTNELGDNPPDLFASTIQLVALPQSDPVFGDKGPLVQIWQPAEQAKL